MRRETDEMNLTAYALGELEGAEREAVEARLAGSAADRQFVEDVRAAARTIGEELVREDTGGLDAIHYAAIEMRLRAGAAGPRPADRSAVVRGRIGFALSLAASIAIVCGVIGVVLVTMGRRNYIALDGPASRPAGQPVLIPFESLPPEQSAPRPGFVSAPPAADPFVSVADHPVSSFALNADTASYEELREALFAGRLPTPKSVKIEGLVNAFAYDDPAPEIGVPFAGRIEIGRCPWDPSHRLARVNVRARDGKGTVAEDAKTEVSFNPAGAKSYRLIGYEADSSASAASAAGERVEAGHSSTALYEIVPTDASRRAVADVLTLRVRFRLPAGGPEQTLEFTAMGPSPEPGHESADFRFAAAVAEFGMILRERPAMQARDEVDHVIAMAEGARGVDPSGARKQFVDLARRAKTLMG